MDPKALAAQLASVGQNFVSVCGKQKLGVPDTAVRPLNTSNDFRIWFYSRVTYRRLVRASIESEHQGSGPQRFTKLCILASWESLTKAVHASA